MTNASSSPLLTIQAARARAKKRAILAASKSVWTKTQLSAMGCAK